MSRAKSFFVPGQLSVVSNGLDLEQFSYTPCKTNGVAKIVGVGSLFPVKQWNRLIDAAHTLEKGRTKVPGSRSLGRVHLEVNCRGT